jgi:hypothetical protein
MLEQPRSQDVGGHFRKYAAFLLILLSVCIIIFLPRPLSAADTRIARVTYNKTIS